MDTEMQTARKTDTRTKIIGEASTRIETEIKTNTDTNMKTETNINQCECPKRSRDRRAHGHPNDNRNADRENYLLLRPPLRKLEQEQYLVYALR